MSSATNNGGLDAALLTRVQGVAEAGELGDSVLWAPGRRAMHATGPNSVLWALLEEPGTITELADVVAAEYGAAVADVLPTVRQAAMTLRSAGLIDIGVDGLEPLPPISRFLLPPSH